jgi:hypothetical protein
MLRHERSVHAEIVMLSCRTCRCIFETTEEVKEHCANEGHIAPETKKISNKVSSMKKQKLKKPNPSPYLRATESSAHTIPTRQPGNSKMVLDSATEIEKTMNMNRQISVDATIDDLFNMVGGNMPLPSNPASIFGNITGSELDNLVPYPDPGQQIYTLPVQNHSQANFGAPNTSFIPNPSKPGFDMSSYNFSQYNSFPLGFGQPMPQAPAPPVMSYANSGLSFLSINQYESENFRPQDNRAKSRLGIMDDLYDGSVTDGLVVREDVDKAGSFPPLPDQLLFD